MCKNIQYVKFEIQKMIKIYQNKPRIFLKHAQNMSKSCPKTSYNMALAQGPWPKGLGAMALAHGNWPRGLGPRALAMDLGPKDLAQGPWPKGLGPRALAQRALAQRALAQRPWPKGRGPNISVVARCCWRSWRAA